MPSGNSEAKAPVRALEVEKESLKGVHTMQIGHIHVRLSRGSTLLKLQVHVQSVDDLVARGEHDDLGPIEFPLPKRHFARELLCRILGGFWEGNFTSGSEGLDIY